MRSNDLNCVGIARPFEGGQSCIYTSSTYEWGSFTGINSLVDTAVSRYNIYLFIKLKTQFQYFINLTISRDYPHHLSKLNYLLIVITIWSTTSNTVHSAMFLSSLSFIPAERFNTASCPPTSATCPCAQASRAALPCYEGPASRLADTP